jgi:hypothetical protein
MRTLREIVEARKSSVAVLGSLSRHSIERQCEAEGKYTFGELTWVRQVDVLELKALVEHDVRGQ